MMIKKTVITVKKDSTDKGYKYYVTLVGKGGVNYVTNPSENDAMSLKREHIENVNGKKAK